MSEDVRRMVGQNVRKLRLAAKISQAELATRMGVDRAYVSGLELGQQVQPAHARQVQVEQRHVEFGPAGLGQGFLAALGRGDGQAGAGETPIVTVAPAIGNALFAASGVRLRSLPMIPDGWKAVAAAR